MKSILRKVNGQYSLDQGSEYHFSSPLPSSSPERATVLDPDVPIPSTEDQSIIDSADDSVIIKPEQGEEELDVFDIPEMYQDRDE